MKTHNSEYSREGIMNRIVSRIAVTALGMLVILAFGSRTPAFAHGDHARVLGTVTALTEESITVQTPERDTKTFIVKASTRFMKSGAKAVLGDLKVGDRVVIEGEGPATALVAVSVQFGPTKPAAPKPAAKTATAPATSSIGAPADHK
jgi:hypothetical protein